MGQMGPREPSRAHDMAWPGPVVAKAGAVMTCYDVAWNCYNVAWSWYVMTWPCYGAAEPWVSIRPYEQVPMGSMAEAPIV